MSMYIEVYRGRFSRPCALVLRGLSALALTSLGAVACSGEWMALALRSGDAPEPPSAVAGEERDAAAPADADMDAAGCLDGPYRWFGYKSPAAAECPLPAGPDAAGWETTRPFAALSGDVSELCVYEAAAILGHAPEPPTLPELRLQPDLQSFARGLPSLECVEPMDLELARLEEEAFARSLRLPRWSELELDVAAAPSVYVAHLDVEQLETSFPVTGSAEHREYTRAVSRRIACEDDLCAFDYEFHDALFFSPSGLRTGHLDVARAAMNAHAAAAAGGVPAVIGFHLFFDDARREPTYGILREVVRQLACAGDLLIAAGGNRSAETPPGLSAAAPADWHDETLICEGEDQGRPPVLRVNGVGLGGAPLRSALRRTPLAALGGPSAFVVEGERVLMARAGSSLASAVVVASVGAMSVLRPELSAVELGAVLLDEYGGEDTPVLDVCGALRAACKASVGAGRCGSIDRVCPEESPPFEEQAYAQAFAAARRATPASLCSRARPPVNPARAACPASGISTGSPARSGDPGFPKLQLLIATSGMLFVTAFDEPSAPIELDLAFFDAQGVSILQAPDLLLSPYATVALAVSEVSVAQATWNDLWTQDISILP